MAFLVLSAFVVNQCAVTDFVVIGEEQIIKDINGILNNKKGLRGVNTSTSYDSCSYLIF